MLKTYNELYIGLQRRLRQAGVEACGLEARLLVASAAGKTPQKLLQDLRLYSSPEIEEKVEALAARRLTGEPAAYILGTWEFYGLELKVTPAVLIPRSDTEVLVDQALMRVADRKAPLRVLDLCTGSGCIGCALGHNLPSAHVVMADLSQAALEIAKYNARACGLGTRAVCMKADALAAPAPQLGRFDLIVSNPPYITSGEMAELDSSVRDYEPAMALEGGPDGLAFYRSITEKWAPLLKPGGWLLFEVGETQADAVEQLMAAAGMTGTGYAEDTAGYRRVVFGKAKEETEMNEIIDK